MRLYPGLRRRVSKVGLPWRSHTADSEHVWPRLVEPAEILRARSAGRASQALRRNQVLRIAVVWDLRPPMRQQSCVKSAPLVQRSVPTAQQPHERKRLSPMEPLHARAPRATAPVDARLARPSQCARLDKGGHRRRASRAGGTRVEERRRLPLRAAALPAPLRCQAAGGAGDAEAAEVVDGEHRDADELGEMRALGRRQRRSSTSRSSSPRSRSTHIVRLPHVHVNHPKRTTQGVHPSHKVFVSRCARRTRRRAPSPRRRGGRACLVLDDLGVALRRRPKTTNFTNDHVLGGDVERAKSPTPTPQVLVLRQRATR